MCNLRCMRNAYISVVYRSQSPRIEARRSPLVRSTVRVRDEMDRGEAIYTKNSRRFARIVKPRSVHVIRTPTVPTSQQGCAEDNREEVLFFFPLSLWLRVSRVGKENLGCFSSGGLHAGGEVVVNEDSLKKNKQNDETGRRRRGKWWWGGW